MHNTVLGKTVYTVRAHDNFEFVNEIKQVRKCVKSPTCKNQHYSHYTMVGIETTKTIVKHAKPFFAGIAILDLSKLHMHGVFSGVLKPHNGANTELGYTDTDSVVIHVQSDSKYAAVKELAEYTYFSDYPKDDRNYDATNKTVFGKMKDERHGQVIEE